YLTVTGYDAPVGTLAAAGASLTATAPTAVNRTVGLIDGNGIVDTSTALSDADAPSIVRSAVTVDGSRVWVSGGNGGVRATPIGSTGASTAVTADANLGRLDVVGGQLLAGGIDTTKLVKVGSGTPLSSAATTALPGISSVTLTNGYAPLDLTGADFAGTGADTLYLANGAEGAGAIDKYRFNGSTWTHVGTVPVEGLLGVAATTSAGAVTLFATTGHALLKLTEATAVSDTFNVVQAQLVTAPADTQFRGVAFAPTSFSGPSLIIRTPQLDAAPTSPPNQLQASVDAISNGAVSGVTVKIDSGTPIAASKSNGTTWNAALPLAGLGQGQHTVTFTGTDGAATTSSSRTFLVGADTTPPVPPVTPTVPAHAFGAGVFSAADLRVSRGKFKPAGYPKAPGRTGISSKVKATAAFQFVGTGIDLHLAGRTDAGKAKIIIDGVVRSIDLYSKKAKDLTTAIRGLGVGLHTVQVVSLKTRGKKSKGFVVLFGYLQVIA
ncbi:MAG: hypothetical protein WCP28_22520, partial [Actinomycetes bacterium]